MIDFDCLFSEEKEIPQFWITLAKFVNQYSQSGFSRFSGNTADRLIPKTKEAKNL
jgi:hypothetical protein